MIKSELKILTGHDTSNGIIDLTKVACYRSILLKVSIGQVGLDNCNLAALTLNIALIVRFRCVIFRGEIEGAKRRNKTKSHVILYGGT